VLGVVVGATVAFLASVILGEYEFVGATPVVAGLVVPLAVAESCALGAGARRPWLWPFAAAAGAAGLAWGVWLSDGRGLAPWPAGGWVAVGLGAGWPLLVAGFRWKRVRATARPAPR
jgi:hypothetical protein